MGLGMSDNSPVEAEQRQSGSWRFRSSAPLLLGLGWQVATALCRIRPHGGSPSAATPRDSRALPGAGDGPSGGRHCNSEKGDASRAGEAVIRAGKLQSPKRLFVASFPRDAPSWLLPHPVPIPGTPPWLRLQGDGIVEAAQARRERADELRGLSFG